MNKIHNITIHNLKSVSDYNATFNGCSVIVTAGNNKGKSTLLKTFPDRLRGEKPELIVREGENNGIATMELTTGEKFIWNFSKDGKEQLKFITREGIKTNCTKEIRDRFFPPLFDIDDFLNSTPKDQILMLQKLVKVDFTAIDERYKIAYADRTYRNRQFEESKSKQLPFDSALPEIETDYTDLIKEVGNIDSHNKLHESKTTQYESIIASRDEYLKQANELLERAKLLEIQMAQLQDWFMDSENSPKNDDGELSSKIANISLDNEKIRNNNIARRQVDELKQLEITAYNADNTVKSIEKERKDLLSQAKLPEGFEISLNGILVDNLPLNKKQLSTSKLYISALKLAALQLGEVKTLHFDASPLDKNSLHDIINWANQNDLQLLIEKPDFNNGEIEYHIIDNSVMDSLDTVVPTINQPVVDLI